ncbi:MULTISPECIES: hypothetical protein [Snodgrassella]|uniref:hypothetical protein n=1 Tax=Snodgrassella TaxID=1193515 RepID=UPI00081552FD|nr:MULTISPECIES: hypothetical protein [Snodgrassella]SCC19474.1 hypothetical protein GA0061082_11632 [Snodgrassella sp. R-53583]
MTNPVQNRPDLELEVAYSLCFEKLMYKFFGRIDKLISFFLLLSSMTAIGSIGGLVNGTFSGIFLAVITAIQIIYTPSAKAQAAKDNYCLYYKLYKKMGSMSDEEIVNHQADSTKRETDEIGLLSHPARLSALAMLGMTPGRKYSEERKLRLSEYFAALFAGELPEYHFEHVISEANNDSQN